MIEAVFTREGGVIRAFAVRGHAGLAPKGDDVVCAAVSALAQGTLIGLEEVLGLRPDVEVQDGWLRCRLPEEGAAAAREVQVLLETLLRSLRSIEEGYEDAVRVREIVRGKGGA